MLHNTDVIIILTGMASHMLMQFAKDCARRSGIHWKCAEKATDSAISSLGLLTTAVAGSIRSCREPDRWQRECSRHRG